MRGNCKTNQKQGNSGKSVEHDQKLMRAGEAHEFAHQIWAKSNEWFVCEYMETAQPIRGL